MLGLDHWAELSAVQFGLDSLKWEWVLLGTDGLAKVRVYNKHGLNIEGWLCEGGIRTALKDNRWSHLKGIAMLPVDLEFNG